MLTIQNHRLTGAPYKPAADHGGKLEGGSAKYIVLHYTAGSGLDSAVATLTGSADPKVSAHVVVGLDGELVQLVDFDTVAWHAGESTWEGLTGLNAHSIGIEIVNPGYAREGVSYSGAMVRARHKSGGPERDWYVYPALQVAAVVELCGALADAYPSIRSVVGHDDIAPGRKVDPGPAWPWSDFWAGFKAVVDPDVPEPDEPTTPATKLLTVSTKPMLSITREQLEHWFTYHPPAPDQRARYTELRTKALEFARAIVELTPPSADQTAAVRKVREAVMTANAAIACEPRGEP